MLPTFSTEIILTLEYIRQCFISDHDHFVVCKAPINFHLPYDVGPLIAIHISALDHVEKMMEDIHFPKASKWHYDPHNVIYNLRKDQEREAHKHVPNIDMERVANL